MAVSSLFVHLLMVVSLAMGPPASNDLFAQIYQRGVAKQRSLQSIRARFTETTVSTLLVNPIVSHGTVVAATPARVRMTYTDPEPKTITMDGQSLTVLWPGRDERQRVYIPAIRKRIGPYFTHASLDDLRGMFQITAEPDRALLHADRVDMKP